MLTWLWNFSLSYCKSVIQGLTRFAVLYLVFIGVWPNIRDRPLSKGSVLFPILVSCRFLSIH